MRNTLIRRKKCECNCGEYAKPGNKYILGHSQRGKPLSKEHKELLRDISIKWRQDHPEFKEKHKAIMKEIWGDPEYKEMMAGKQSRAGIKRYKRPEEREKQAERMKATWSNSEWKAKECQLIRIAQNKKSTKEKHRKATELLWGNPEWRSKQIEILKAIWDDPEYKNRILLARAEPGRPNKQENFILFLLNRMYPGEWRYTGDFSTIINGKNPDFININGQKKVIEFNGTYWHQYDIPGEREKIFSEYGYDTLIIWDHELKNMNRLKFRINKFARS